MTTDRDELEDEIFKLATVNTLSRSEILSLLKRVSERVKAIPTIPSRAIRAIGDNFAEIDDCEPRDEPESPGWGYGEDGPFQY